MQQEKSNPQEQIKNYGRRSRKDEEGRDYVCGCGKSYLSYPALYTHIKTKHEGQRPEGTYKIGISSGARRTNSNSNNSNAYNTGNITDQSITYLGKTKNYQQAAILTTLQPPIESKIPLQILSQLQKLTKLEDFKILSQLQLSLDTTHPDNRIKIEQVGQAIFQNYNQLIQQAQKCEKSHISLDDSEPVNGDVLQNQQILQNSQVQKWTKITCKSQLQTVLVVFLLGVGRSVSEELMDVYGEFAKMFRQCYYDHADEIYQVCFKNNEYYETKQRQRQRQKQRQRERDNPYKCYQYSYPPSSSKSKTYNSYNTPSPQNPYSLVSPAVPASIISNLTINKNECKYSPIICQFFIRVFVPSFNKQQHFKQIMQLICNDFCTWMYRNKISVVEIGLNKKYDNAKRQSLKMKIQTKICKKNKKQIDAIDDQYDNFQMNNSPNKKIKNQTYYRRGEKNKRKDKHKRGRYGGNYTTNYKPSSSRTKVALQRNRNNESNDNQNQYEPDELELAQLQNQDDIQILNQNHEHPSSDQGHHEEQSYKIGQQIVHELAVRDRSGSIHHYINGNNDHDENQGLPEYQPAHEQAGVPRSRKRLNQQNAHQSGSGSNINQQEIQQYINP